jgi:hypothetical protein
MALISNMTVTWNNVATTFTAIKMNATDTASAAGTLFQDMQVGGSSRYAVGKAGTALVVSTGYFGWGSTTATSTPDVLLHRDAANTLAQRNGANAQTFRLYNTFTDASNFERFSINWASNECRIATNNGGTGSNRSILLRTDGIGELRFQTNSADRWKIDASGHFLGGLDNTYDIGTSGASRPRSIYAGTSVVTPYVETVTGFTVAGLPTPTAGRMARVTDANAPVVGNVVAGGGAAFAMVVANGTSWKVIAT